MTNWQLCHDQDVSGNRVTDDVRHMSRVIRSITLNTPQAKDFCVAIDIEWNCIRNINSNEDGNKHKHNLSLIMPRCQELTGVETMAHNTLLDAREAEE